MQKIILASSSPQRQSLMASLNITFAVIPADVEEKTIRDQNPKKQAEKIARAKAEKVAATNTGIIVAADSFVVCEGKILEKPKNQEEAIEMLKSLSGKTATLYSGLCYIDKEKSLDYSTTVETEFTFRKPD